MKKIRGYGGQVLTTLSYVGYIQQIHNSQNVNYFENVNLFDRRAYAKLLVSQRYIMYIKCKYK